MPQSTDFTVIASNVNEALLESVLHMSQVAVVANYSRLPTLALAFRP